MEVFPKFLTSQWDKLQIPGLVLLSLLVQIILIYLGSMRKYRVSVLFSVFSWVAYLWADWLATTTLGNLVSKQGDNDDNGDKSKCKTSSNNNEQVIQALWAPFLLLHLGGPDTITAYALEDNSLWTRHLLTLLLQVALAGYVFLRSLGTDPISFVSIPVFVSGIIKYSERIYALWAASHGHLEDSLISALTLQAPDLRHGDSDLECLLKGYSLFPLVQRLYADLSLTFAEGQQSYSLMVKEGSIASYAFDLVEIQLGFLFDVLYTKATVIYSLVGLILRLISFISIVSALLAFIIVIRHTVHTYSSADAAITYILFVGAIFLEIHAFVSLVLSDWTRRYLTEHKSTWGNPVYNFISWCRKRILPRQRRWSESIAQHNLVDFCLKEKECMGRTDSSGSIYSKICFEKRKVCFKLKLLWRRKWQKVDDLKSFILDELDKKYRTYKESGFEGRVLKDLLSHRGDNVITRRKFDDVIGWSLELEFDHSIILWHVATDICYYSPNRGARSDSKREASRKLSNYILYILLMRPSMLPKWIDRISHVRDTFDQAIKLFHRKKFPVRTSEDACSMLMQLHTQCQVLELLRREKSGKSVLVDACSLASQLQDHLKENLWDTVLEVWIEMLTYAAIQGDWDSHAQQLPSGGEFLTHVALLMADLGLSEHFGTIMKGPQVDSQNNIGWGWARSKLASPDASDYLLSNRVN